MVFPIGGAPDSTPKQKSTRSDETEEILSSYREIYNNAKGDKSVFTQKVVAQYGYSTEDTDDNAEISQIFGFLRSSDGKDGKLDGNVTTQQLITDLEVEKFEVENRLQLDLEHNFGANLDKYYKIKEKDGDEAADNYLKQCIKENVFGEEVDQESLELYFKDAKLTIEAAELNTQRLENGILSTEIDQLVEELQNNIDKEIGKQQKQKQQTTALDPTSDDNIGTFWSP